MLYIYKASAGSGKTFNLTKRYLTYLLAEKGDDGRYRLRRQGKSLHQHQLAITFTNKATNEMATRIVKQLAILAAMDPDGGKSPYEAEFVREFGCTARELRDRARVALVDLLFDYSYFNISTIDSFFQTVLRLFSREVDIPDNYGIDLDLNHAVALAVGELFNSLNYNGRDLDERQLREWLKDWIYNNMMNRLKDGKKFNVFSRRGRVFNDLVKSIHDMLSKEEFKTGYGALKDYFADRGNIVRFRNSVAEVMAHRRGMLEKASTEYLNTVPGDMLSANWRKWVESWSVGECMAGAGKATLSKIIESSGRSGAFPAAVIKKGLDSEIIARTGALAEMAEHVHRTMSVLTPVFQSLNTLGLTWIVSDFVDRYARDNNLLLLNQTGNLLSGIINDDETPFVYERLGYYLNHFLLDEFQDTSPIQWDNLRPLLIESLSRGNDNLIIGDEKQCIYRFRSSDPRLLGSKVQEDVEKRFAGQEVVEIEGMRLTENNNWRSSPEIVRFNNTIFRAMSSALGSALSAEEDRRVLARTYYNIEQHIDPHRSTRPGYVKLQFLNNLTPEGCKNNVTDLEALSLKLLAEDITRQLTEGGYQPRDIAVLVDTREQGGKVINHLMQCMADAGSMMPNFQIISADSLFVGASPAVKFVISILRLIMMPGRTVADAAEAECEETPEEKRRRLALMRAKLANRLQYYRSRPVEDSDSGERRLPTYTEAFMSALEFNRGTTSEQLVEDMRRLSDMKCFSIPGIVQRIIDEYLDPQDRYEQMAYIAAFQDAVLDFTSRLGHDIRAFINWWDRTGYLTAVTSPDGINAVTVSTIHKAKGLEYPCVHVPFADNKFVRFQGEEWFGVDRQKFAEEYGVDVNIVPPFLALEPKAWMDGSPLFEREYNDRVTQQLIDRLNVCYVAFTRPTTELIIHTADEKGCLGESLRQAIESSVSESQWYLGLTQAFDGTTLEIGSPTVNTSSEPIRKVRIPPVRPAQSKEARTLIELDDTESFDIEKPRHVGLFLHSVLAKTSHAGRLRLAFDRQAHRYKLPESHRDEMWRRIESMTCHPDAARWFAPGVRAINERPLTIDGDHRRPDRVVIMPDGSVEVIDYKFVEKIPDLIEEDATFRRYSHAVRRYCRGISKALCKSGVKGYLWYVSPEDMAVIPVN